MDLARQKKQIRIRSFRKPDPKPEDFQPPEFFSLTIDWLKYFFPRNLRVCFSNFNCFKFSSNKALYKFLKITGDFLQENLVVLLQMIFFFFTLLHIRFKYMIVIWYIYELISLMKKIYLYRQVYRGTCFFYFKLFEY